jgi:hypothetical protein
LNLCILIFSNLTPSSPDLNSQRPRSTYRDRIRSTNQK